MKSILMKLSTLFVFVLIFMMMTMATVYGETKGSDNDFAHEYDEGIISNSPLQDRSLIPDPTLLSIVEINYVRDHQPPAVAAVTVHQTGDKNNDTTNGIQGTPLSQDNYNDPTLAPTHKHDIIADVIDDSTVSIAPEKVSTQERSVQNTSLQIRKPVSLKSSQTTTTATIRPSQAENHLEIITRAEQSGNLLQNASFSIYRVVDSQLVGNVSTDIDGKASISLDQGEYYMRNDSVLYGYLHEQSRIFFNVGASDSVTIEVTIQRDANMLDLEGGIITVPKTGELMPIMKYLQGTIFLKVALFCCIDLLIQQRLNNYKRKVAKTYA